MEPLIQDKKSAALAVRTAIAHNEAQNVSFLMLTPEFSALLPSSHSAELRQLTNGFVAMSNKALAEELSTIAAQWEQEVHAAEHPTQSVPVAYMGPEQAPSASTTSDPIVIPAGGGASGPRKPKK